jgi:hypothetical protein
MKWPMRDCLNLNDNRSCTADVYRISDLWFPSEARPRQHFVLSERPAVSPAANSIISAVTSSCRTILWVTCKAESLRSIWLRAEAIASMRALVLRREGVQRGVAKLRLHVVRCQIDQKRLRRQVQQRRIDIVGARKAPDISRGNKRRRSI